MKKTPVKGTNDYLPREAALRDHLKKTILDIYTENGFEHIYTPAIEDAENLDKSEGGENLSLIFNILKRGEKLDKLIEEGAETLLKLINRIDEDVMKAPAFRMVLTGTGTYAYQRKDGIFTVPIGCLRD